jgi:carbonic anhydrase
MLTIFSDIFVIRTAGNVVSVFELGSIEYGVEHLGAKLVVVMGHTGCGAVAAAIAGEATGHIKTLVDEIKSGIGDEKDSAKAESLLYAILIIVKFRFEYIKQSTKNC